MVYIFLTLVFWKGAGKEKELVMNLLCYKYQHFFLNSGMIVCLTYTI